MFIEQPAIYLRWLYPKAYWRMDRHEKAVYLTFDDGPIPEATPFILDTLKAFGVGFTFRGTYFSKKKPTMYISQARRASFIYRRQKSRKTLI